MNPAIVVGGGLSGLAAAVTLARQSIPVVLLEQKPFLGGRAYSFADRSTGTDVDNGQHLLIAGYTATLDFVRILGSLPLLRIQRHPELVFHHPDRGFQRFSLPLWPPPLNLLCGVMATGLFSARNKRRLLSGGRALLRSAERIPAEWTVAAWLASTSQDDETRRSFWDPLAVAIMNERPETASARVFVRSLRRAFLSHRRGAALAVPTVGLSRLFADPAEAFILARGGAVQRSAEVESLSVQEGSATGVRLRNGREIPCSSVVLAVPPSCVARLLPGAAAQKDLEGIPVAPIVSIHLWFTSEFMQSDAVGIIGKQIQWVFRKRDHVSVTISAAYDLLQYDNATLVRQAVEDLRAIYGPAVGSVRHSLVIREKRATISCSPSVDRRRPGNGTTIPNVVLAGDWTDTGLPATIEGAVISGNRAAEMVFERVRGIH